MDMPPGTLVSGGAVVKGLPSRNFFHFNWNHIGKQKLRDLRQPNEPANSKTQKTPISFKHGRPSQQSIGLTGVLWLKLNGQAIRESWTGGCSVSLNLIQELESRHGAMKVSELTELLGVDDKHIYRMAARGQLPSFRVGGAVRFDPQEVAKWLRLKYGPDDATGRRPPERVGPSRGVEQRIA
jgi:excisionase family DNA binding protein